MMRSYSDPSFSNFGTNLRLTKAVKALLIIHGVVFLLELLIGKLGGENFLLYQMSLSFDGFLLGGRLWQPFTYMFLHDPYGVSHLLWNMLMLWMFGTSLEAFWGGHRFVRFYLLTGFLAGVAVLLVGLVAPSQRGPVMGASGALYALLIAFGFNFPNAMIFLFGLFPIKGKHLVMLFVGLGILQSLTLGGSNVSTSAHFGGMLAGLVLVTGAWRPGKLWGWAKLWWMKRRYRKLKHRLKVVDRDEDNSDYLH
jgi:membrane associated rhomboid family serine protease